MTRPLDGVKVLDFSTLLPGPLASLFLAEAGAEVIKIEPPSGEEMRRYEPRWGDESASFAMLNRGKKSLAIDLKSPDALAKLEPLLTTSDILLEQFRPGVMARLGLDYEAVSALNPGIIYCSITGYGQDGPKAGRAGHDLNYMGDAGLLSLSCGSLEHPVVPPALIADIAGGSYPAVLNILLALRQRESTGRGTHLDIAMAEGVFPFLFWALAGRQATGASPKNGEEQLTGGSPRYRLYPMADGYFLAVATLEEKFWQAFVEAIGLERDLRDDRLDPAATIAAVATIIARRPARDWEEELQDADCCCTIVKSLEEALADPHFASRGLFAHQLRNEAGDHMPALPLPLSPAFRHSPDEPLAVPSLGGAQRAPVGRLVPSRC